MSLENFSCDLERRDTALLKSQSIVTSSPSNRSEVRCQGRRRTYSPAPKCGSQPAHQSLITDIPQFRFHLCATIFFGPIQNIRQPLCSRQTGARSKIGTAGTIGKLKTTSSRLIRRDFRDHLARVDPQAECSGPGRNASFRASAPRSRSSSSPSSSKAPEAKGAGTRARFTLTLARGAEGVSTARQVW